MAVRPIDGNELYRIEKLLDTDIVRQDKVALNLLEQVIYDIQHVPTLTPPNEWVSVENAVPDPGERVLATDGTFVGEAYRTSANTWYRHTGFPWRDCLQSIVTLWMPLPTADKDNNVPAKTPNEPLSILVLDEPDREYIDYICPKCKNTISQRRRGQLMRNVYQCKYHDNCGQRVDWHNPQPYHIPLEGETDEE